MPSDVKTLLLSGAQLTDAALERLLPSPDILPHSIHRAMRHSVFAGGKRLRPILCMEAARMVAKNRRRRNPRRRSQPRRSPRDDPHLLPHPRRPPRPRQRRPPPRQAHLPRRLRRSHRHPRRRRPPDPRLPNHIRPANAARHHCRHSPRGIARHRHRRRYPTAHSPPA